MLEPRGGAKVPKPKSQQRVLRGRDFAPHGQTALLGHPGWRRFTRAAFLGHGAEKQTCLVPLIGVASCAQPFWTGSSTRPCFAA